MNNTTEILSYIEYLANSQVNTNTRKIRLGIVRSYGSGESCFINSLLESSFPSSHLLSYKYSISFGKEYSETKDKAGSMRIIQYNSTWLEKYNVEIQSIDDYPCSSKLDACIFLCNAASGINSYSKIHLHVLNEYGIPTIVILTRANLISDDDYMHVLEYTRRCLAEYSKITVFSTKEAIITTNITKEVSREVQSLVGGFLSKIGLQSQLSDSSTYDINVKINDIRRKMRDPKLYLALVGEFSSGKSTFINALLGFRLLKEAVMPTTACATYIKSGGDVLTIDVAFFDGEKFHSTSADFNAISDYLFSKYKRGYISLQKIIEDITSYQTIAKTVKELQITIPNAKIPKNIVLIDTPGFNPGADSVDNHYEITKYVVENVADAALVLTPQEQAMSATLIRFLNETLHRFLHRCSFVITKMDNQLPENRFDIIQYARQQIVTNLNIASPHLYAESAITMLPVKKVPLEKKEDWKFFQNEFKKFEKAIWEDLQRNKEVVLKEHINVLVKDIVVLCTQKLQEREAVIKKDRQFLEEHKVESIQSVCDMMISQSIMAIHSALNNLNTSFYNAENASKRKSDSIIDDGIMSIVSFKDKMMPSIRKVVEEEAGKRLASINIELNNTVKQCVNSQIAKMQRVFASHYNSFSALRPSESAPTVNLVKLNNCNISFFMAISKIEELDKKENQAAGTGAILGGIVGFLIGGPVGAAAGAVLGGGGGAIANDQSDAMRASAKSIVKDEISSFYSSLRIKINNEIDKVKSSYFDLIRHFADNHVNKYGKAVEQLILQHQANVDAIDKEIADLKMNINKLNDIENDIEQELAILKINIK